MKIVIRAATEPERMYCFPQSTQICAQTGCIGRLRISFGETGDQFDTDWTDNRSYLKTDEFKAEFDELINSLRFEHEFGDVLESRYGLSEFCQSHPEALVSKAGADCYLLRIDSDKYSYLLLLAYGTNDNSFVFCYRKDWLDQHMKKAENGIRFVAPEYRDLFRIEDGSRIQITYPSGKIEEKLCRYIDDYHVEINGCLYHICEFAEIVQKNSWIVYPVTGVLQNFILP